MGEQDVQGSGGGKDLGLTERRRRQSGGSVLELTPGDKGTLVRLRMRAEAEPQAGRPRLHGGEIRLHGCDVDDGEGRLEVGGRGQGCTRVHQRGCR